MSGQEEDERMEILTRKARFFFESKLPIHIVLKDGTWENGTIDFLGSDFIRLSYPLDIVEKKGKPGDYIFFLEIKDIEEYFQREER